MKYAGSLHILNVKCKQPTSVYLNGIWLRYSLHKQMQLKVFRFLQVGTKLSVMCFRFLYSGHRMSCALLYINVIWAMCTYESAISLANYPSLWCVWNDQMVFLKGRALAIKETWCVESSQFGPLSPLSASSEVRVYFHHHDLSVLGSKCERAPVDSEVT